MLNNVMPQRGVFFSLLVAHTDRLVAAANATLRLISGLGNPQFDTTTLIDEVNLNETSADDLSGTSTALSSPTLSAPMNEFLWIVAGDSLYVFGGYRGAAGYTTAIQRFAIE